jgi:proliferating cell nuclear antigen
MSSADADAVLTTSIDAGTLRTTLDVLQTAADEAKLHLGADGLEVHIVDPANVMMHHIDVSAAAFRTTPSGSFTVGVNLERLADFCAKAGSGQTIDFSFKPATRELNIQYDRVDYDMACIDPDSIRKEPDVNDLDLPNWATVPTSDLSDALYHADLVSDHVNLTCDSDAETLTVTAEGDTDDVTVTLDDAEFVNHHIREDTTAKFSMAYLYSGSQGSGDHGKVVKEIPGEEVTVTLGDEFPMWLDYEYADGDAEVRTMLAPRIGR